jgi:hypothetical protein
VAWLPGGKELLVVKKASYKHWADFPGDIRTAPPSAPRVQAALLAGNGDWDKTIAALGDVTEDDRDRVMMMFLDDQGKTPPGEVKLPEAVVSMLRSRPELKEYAPTVCERIDISGGGAKAAEPLVFVGHVDDSLEMRVSPSGEYVAITDMPKSDSGKATLLCIEKTHPNAGDDGLILDAGSMYPDWTPDGKSLVYLRAFSLGDQSIQKSDTLIGTLSRQRLIDDRGALYAHGKLPAREDLAGTLFDGLGRVRCAADGRIFFTSINVTLPATPNDVPSRAGVFMVDPGKQGTVARVVPRSAEEAVGDAPQFFELSPDGKRLSIPFKDGRVSVLTIATGEVLQVQTAGMGQPGDLSLPSVPTWRNDRELTFVRPAGEGKEVVRYDVEDSRHAEVVMSRDWDAAVKKQWLSKKE